MKRRDPTGTTRLRSLFRRELDRRIVNFMNHVRGTLIDQDFLGIVPHPMMFGRVPDLDTKLLVLTNYINQLAYIVIVQQGEWLNNHMDVAFRSGLKAGERWSGRPLDAYVQAVYYQFAKNELEGIVDAFVQRASREAHLGLTKRETPRMLFMRINSTIKKIVQVRGYMLVNQLVVQQHNLGRMEQMREAGITKVGVIPETLPKGLKAPRKPRHDHKVHDAPMWGGSPGEEELVNVLTAEDDDVCEECEDYADSGPYEIEDVEIPLHPNCRCAVVPFDDRRFETNIENLERFLTRSDLEEEVE